MTALSRSESVILLPPSEKKRSGGERGGWLRSFPTLDPGRHEVIEALHRYLRRPDAHHQRLFGVKGDALAEAIVKNLAVLDSPTLPAVERYEGVLYNELNYRSLSAAAKQSFDDSAVIFSGLWGLVRPTDPLPDYKLKMGAALPPMNRLATWWRPQLSVALDDFVTDRVVWDLLPQEHATAWKGATETYRLRIGVWFLDERGRRVAHWNKLLKGSLVRLIVEHQPTSVEELIGFEHPEGYELDLKDSLSEGRTAVAIFRKTEPAAKKPRAI